MLRGGFTIGLAGLLFVLLLKVDVLLLSFLDSNAEVGLYAAAYRLIEGDAVRPVGVRRGDAAVARAHDRARR